MCLSINIGKGVGARPYTDDSTARSVDPESPNLSGAGNNIMFAGRTGETSELRNSISTVVVQRDRLLTDSDRVSSPRGSPKFRGAAGQFPDPPLGLKQTTLQIRNSS